MNYSNIKEYDIANGPGIRYTLFVSGCRHTHRLLLNPETWDFAHGKPFTKDIEDHILEEVGQEYYEGLTLLGSEPMEPSNRERPSLPRHALQEQLPAENHLVLLRLPLRP